MKKNINIPLAVLMVTNVFSQHFGDVDISLLASQLARADQDITQIWRDGKMYYVDSQTNKLMIHKGFDVAYPFFKKAALIKENGTYAVIDRKGNYLVQPTHTKVEVAPFDNESYLVILDGALIFDLENGREVPYYLQDEEPFVPSFSDLKDEYGKQGLKKEDGHQSEAAYDSILAFGYDFAIVLKNEKIGVLGIHGNILVDFDYDDATFSTSGYTGRTHPVFGLKRENKWTYFKKGTRIGTSKYKCISFETLLPKSIGIFQKKGGHKILFEDGSTSKRRYDFITENGLVGVRNNKVYILKNTLDQLYYHKKR